MIRGVTFVAEGGARLDAALTVACPASTRAFIRKAIAEGKVLVGGRPVPKGRKLRPGEEIHVVELLEASDNLPLPDPSIRVNPVFEDDALLAIDKPAGMPVQPLSCTEKGTLANAVAARWPQCAPLGDRPLMAGAIHRIDAGTSGLVLFAKTAQAFESMRTQFAAQSVEKKYLALVEDAVAVGATLKSDLVHDPRLPFCKMIDFANNRLSRAEREGLKPLHAVTKFAPVGMTTVGCETRTLLEVSIFTGVTHQIRAQLAAAGMHIVNDTLYGAFAVENQTGHCLHALSAAFLHPVSGQKVVIETSRPRWALDGFQG